MRYLAIVGLALAMAACTMFGGWYAVPLAAILFAAISRNASAPLQAAIAALVAWLVLLLRHATSPAFTRLLEQLGGIFPMPGFVVAIVSLLLAALLAWSGARLTIGLIGIRDTGANAAA